MTHTLYATSSVILLCVVLRVIAVAFSYQLGTVTVALELVLLPDLCILMFCPPTFSTDGAALKGTQRGTPKLILLVPIPLPAK